jgi:glycosyltransferase involved in cell wall biosynthesis
MPHKIDIVIPCYNYAHFLDDCLNAVLAQTRTDFSVLLMDNASTDNTAAVAATWMQRDPRIQYQRNESNIGAVGNMQRGYELTAAEYVVILPADDLWEPSFLARTCDALDQHPECSYAYTGWGTCRQAGDLLGKMTTVPHQNDGVVEDMPFLTCRTTFLCHSAFSGAACASRLGGCIPASYRCSATSICGCACPPKVHPILLTSNWAACVSTAKTPRTNCTPPAAAPTTRSTCSI